MLFHILSILTLFLSSPRAHAAEDLVKVLKKASQGTRTPGMGALIMRDGKVESLVVQGLRRNDGKERVRKDDVWMIGSTSKPMTIALVAKLVDRGTLAWDTPLAQYLPELAGTMRADYQKVNLVQLLSHRSGLPENILDLKYLDTYFKDTRPLPQQRLAFITEALKDAPVAPPGTKFNYSNTGFLIAAVIAEKVTNKSFEELMKLEVFQALDMKSAGFGPTTGAQPLGHRAGKPVTAAMTKSDDGVPPMYTPAGNMHMSLGDWARFCLDQIAGNQGRGKLLKSESYRLMQTAQEGSPSGVDWGVQESIAGRKGPVLVHGGSDGNWLAWVVLFPKEGTGVLMVANAAEDMGADKATQAALGAVFPSLSPAKGP